MSESGDYDPGPWRGHDFASAYEHYDAHVGRSYSDAVAESKPRVDVLEAILETLATNPLIIWSDVTGSMGEWPTTMFSKLPYLELEAQEYLGKDLQIAFGAIGDASARDKYPVQMRAFTSGTDLKARMQELVVEGKGGGGLQESYELGALYTLHNVKMKKAVNPIVIFIGDEKPYEQISPEMALMAGVKLEKRVTTKEVFTQLKRKFSVYLIRKPYHESGSNAMSAEDKEVRSVWVDLLGSDHICDLPEPGRVVDVIFGILARETGRIEYFREEIEGRQKKDQVKTVYRSLASIHEIEGPVASRAGASIMKIDDKRKGGATKKLI